MFDFEKKVIISDWTICKTKLGAEIKECVLKFNRNKLKYINEGETQ